VKLNTREKRIILTGVCVIVGVVIYYAATTLLPDGENLAQEVNLKKKMLLKQRETLLREDFFKTRMDQYRKQFEKDMTRLLPGDNPNVAGAELQKMLKDFADQSGVEIIQKNILQEKKVQDSLTKVSVRIDTKCNMEQIVQFLSAIENYEKYLKVDEFTIFGSSFGSGTQKKVEIRPSLTVAGYINTKEAKPKEASASGI
jgi:type II secretory pathway component PulM